MLTKVIGRSAPLNKVRCAAFVAAAATTAKTMYGMLAMMGGWEGPASRGYKWARVVSKAGFLVYKPGKAASR